jgi:hypothetical protein
MVGHGAGLATFWAMKGNGDLRPALSSAAALRQSRRWDHDEQTASNRR